MSILFVTGGIRSGKSGFAERMAQERGGNRVAYVATAQAWDSEMEERIKVHQEQRPGDWVTYEIPLELEKELVHVNQPVVLVETLSGWIANLLVSYPDSEWHRPHVRHAVEERINALLHMFLKHDLRTWIVVSDEVGLGGVAQTPLGRLFQDVVGWANQRVAALADEVIFVVSGLPWVVKGKGDGGNQ